ncbi:hypothetical protein FDN13_01305 [Caloramator sp. E03]|uniref:hypothetical protein n=1 Tax=Caloramator sp. E03 TaxID=2576307 RepID=UPI0011102A5E|nr:hypothetical protein [Caloramator sp. E03]QCX32442.1 hypothetical protein FDN13_01305 [Caloramator sp. E03]
MDNEKLFELMTKMYSELQSTKTEMQNGFKEVKERLEKVENAVTGLEYELKETKKALYDGYAQNTESIKRIEIKLDEISEKVDKHDIKIQVIEGGKKAL